MTTVPDCQTCGACCTTGAPGKHAEKIALLPIGKAEYRRLPSDVTVRADVTGLGKAYSLRFAGDRCAALDGVVGLSCTCRVYANRPQICRAFPAGSSHCLAARRERGIGAT